MTATLIQLNISNGGIPKRPVDSARVTRFGVEGDAQRNLKSALMYERDNARYKEKLAEVEQRLAQDFTDKGQQFWIR